MPLKMSDEKIITLLDLAVDRAEVTQGVCSALERLKLYQENLDLMERIDVAEVLLADLEDVLNTEYTAALKQFENYEREHLLNQMERLSLEGKDAYWTNGNSDLILETVTLPWRDEG